MLGNMKILLFALVIMTVFTAFILLFVDIPSKPYVPEHIYCAGDRFTCPDGSTVFRMPNDCEFAACPVAGE